MSKYYNGESANEMFHGDEHYCWGDCEGDKYNSCTCDAAREAIFENMAEEFQEWLVQEGQAPSC